MQTVVFDFDGVINSYKSGWGNGIDLPDQPVEGIQDAIRDIREAGYKVIVVSSRCSTMGGMIRIEKYLDKWNIEVDGILSEKPAAIVYIDDRAICFDGRPENLLTQIRQFKPWNMK